MNLVEWAESSIIKGEQEVSKINEDVLAVDGMSSAKSRHLLNNLCSFDGVVYLEIGSWKGSTIIAAAYKNNGHFYAIDNFGKWFKEKDSPAKAFFANKKKFEDSADYKFFECDSWDFDKSNIEGKINVYFYDGDHTFEGTQKAFSYYDDVLADEFILVMDDWNRGHIRDATREALKNYTILYEKELFTPGRKNDPHGAKGIGSTEGRTVQTWWNGLYVSVLKKS